MKKINIYSFTDEQINRFGESDIIAIKKTLLFFLVFVPLYSFTQSGPAGIGNAANNVLWLKADAGTSSIIDGDAISSWTDQSGNSNTVSQANTVRQPLFRTNIINGFPAIQFDNNLGNNDKLQGADSPTLDNTSGLTVFTVTQPTNLDGAARTIISKRVNVGLDQSYMLFYYTGNRLYTDVVSNNDRFDTNPTSFANNTNYILNLVYDGSLAAANRCKIYSGENLIKTASESSSSIPDYNSPLVIGATHDVDNRPFGGYISEIIIYREALSDVKRIIVDNYLSSKYNINLVANDFYSGDLPANGNFDRHVAGIGKSSAGNENTSFDPSAAQGMGITYVSGFNNGDYLFAGNNLAENDNIYTDISVLSGGPVQARWDRIWYLDVTNTSSGILSNLTFDLSDGGFSGSASNVSGYVLLYRSVNSGNWSIVANATSIAGDQITFANYSFDDNSDDGFYTIGITDFASNLPIELTYFDAYYSDEKVIVNWQTASEINNDYFIVERSSDGINFEPILFTDGAGNSNSILEYTETDFNPLQGTSYYRLKQTDFNGVSSFSNIKVVKTYPVLAGELNLFPNPTDGAFHLMLSGFGDEEILVVLRDMAGKEFYSKIIITSTDNHIEAIDPSEKLQPGIYFVTASAKNELYSQKLIIK